MLRSHSTRWSPSIMHSVRSARAARIRVATAAALLLAASCFGAPEISAWRAVSPSLAHTAEFAFQVKGDYDNPFDPQQIRVDADVTGPGGRSWTVPAFWMWPCAMRAEAPEKRWAGLTFMQFYIAGAAAPRGKPVRFAFSDAALENRETGQRRSLPAFTDPAAWARASGVTVEAGEGSDGKPALMVTVVPNGKGYPGIRMVPEAALSDW